MTSALASYPSEFTSHLVPLLFAAGLNPPPPPPAPTPPLATDAEAGQGGPAPTTPPPATPPASQDPFVILQASLRKALAPRKSFPIWDNSRGTNNEFHVVLVDKNIRFPPLKARPSSATQQPPQPLHSPISPLSPTSPLYPDGIMAPIWIRKHREMVPSVFVLVLRLGEQQHSALAGASTGLNPLDPNYQEEQRSQDVELVREILERKRSTLERGIKLAVVLLCSRRLLDDPALDTRLSLIRRQSGLDSRASLFVISPVPQSEVNNFVLSLRAELFPAALDYYREHGRRVRRKRARQVPKGGLSDKGWTVRYDYKMGLFSEMRGEIEVALKHYEDAYETLVEMFSHTTLLAPRTKRWAEAKVLADCLTVKVSKLYLYLNEPSRSVAQLNRHVNRFRELSNIWGIGEETFEFWSWLSKQYRLFGDLVAIGIRAGFRLPSLRPPPSARIAPPGSQQLPSPSLVPPNVLQHPGYYFYLAGSCAVQRRDRFRALAKAEGLATPVEGQPAPATSPAMAHETKVNHAEIIIELYSKAYEFMKVHKTKNMTFFVASQIALAHFEGGNHEMALKFHERISKNYRKDEWRSILDSILRLSIESAQQVGEYESALRYILELLAPDSTLSVDQRASYASKLLEIAQSQTPLSPEKALVAVDMTEIPPLFDCRLVFWQPSSDLREPIPFQLSLAASSTSRSSSLVFTQLAIQFSDGRAPLIISHNDAPTSTGKVEDYALGGIGDETGSPEATSASLCWHDSTTKVFSGTLSSTADTDLTVTDVKLTAKIGDWTIELLLKPDDRSAYVPVWHVESQRVPVLHDRPSICSVRPRELRLSVDVAHEGPAYLGEAFAIHVDVENEDEVDIDVFLDILLQPGEDDSPNQLLVDDQTSLSFIKDVALGHLSPGTRLRKTFRLSCVGSPGDRQLDLSIRSQATAGTGTLPSATELLRSFTVSAERPLHCAFDTQFHRKRRPGKALLDMSEPNGWESSSEVTVLATLHAAGPWDLEVVGLKLDCEPSSKVRVVQSSLGQPSSPLSLYWKPGQLYNCIFRLEVSPSYDPATSPPLLEVLWRRVGDASAATMTTVPLPSLLPPPLAPLVSLRLPSHLSHHTPATLSYTLSNPTPQFLSLSSQIDSSPEFVFAGPRKFPRLFLAPDEERTIDVRVVPLAVGALKLPRFRVFQHEAAPEGEEVEERVVEVVVAEENEVEVQKDPRQAGLEEDLKLARGEEVEGGAAVTVLPLEDIRNHAVLVLPV